MRRAAHGDLLGVGVRGSVHPARAPGLGDGSSARSSGRGRRPDAGHPGGGCGDRGRAAEPGGVGPPGHGTCRGRRGRRGPRRSRAGRRLAPARLGRARCRRVVAAGGRCRGVPRMAAGQVARLGAAPVAGRGERSSLGAAGGGGPQVASPGPGGRRRPRLGPDAWGRHAAPVVAETAVAARRDADRGRSRGGRHVARRGAGRPRPGRSPGPGGRRRTILTTHGVHDDRDNTGAVGLAHAENGDRRPGYRPWLASPPGARARA